MMIHNNFSQKIEYCKALCKQYNSTNENELEKRILIYNELFGSYGRNLSIRAPFHCSLGKNIFLGDNVYMNFDCFIDDIANVSINDNTLIAPRVKIGYSSKENSLDDNNLSKNIDIGKNVWIGGGVIISWGVSIGDNVVIGAGSVVNNDIPMNCVAVGNPCKVLRYLE